MKRYILILTISTAALLSENAFAQQDWKYFLTTTDGSQFYLSRLKKIKNVTRVWEKFDIAEADTAQGYNRTITIKQRVALNEYDCDRQQTRQLSVTLYYVDGSIYSKDSTFEWRYIIPGSIVEDVLNYLCNDKLPYADNTPPTATAPATAPATPPPPTPSSATPHKVQIEIQDNPDGNIPGVRLIYKVKELLRSSSRYEINYGKGARWVLSIATIDRNCADKNISTFYSWVLRLILPNPSDIDDRYLHDYYLDTSSGFCGEDVVQSSAEAIVANVDRDIDAAIQAASTK